MRNRKGPALTVLTLLLVLCVTAGCSAPAAQSSEAAVSPTAAPTPAPTAASVPAPATAEPTPTPVPTPDMSPLGADFFNDAVFLGDSITKKLEVYTYRSDEIGEPNFITQSSFSVRNALKNEGYITYGGKNLRFSEAIAETGASRLFILLGTNDVGIVGVDRTMENWVKFLQMIREHNPDIDIYIQSCMPMYAASQIPTLNNALIDEYNGRLRTFAEENGCFFVDIAPAFKNENGDLIESLSEDMYVHVNEDGCHLWAQTLCDPSVYSDLKR